MTTTILARDLKPGDVIDFGGQSATVTSLLSPTDYGTILVSVAGLWRPDYESNLTIAADLPLNVQRPDPDAELVEVMARAIGDRLEVHWRMDDFDQQTPADQENARRDARAALAAAREAGLL